MKILVKISLAAATAACLVGCKSKQIQVALLAPASSDFWSIVKAGADKGAADFNVHCETVTPSQAGAAEQKARLEELLSRGIQGIAIAPYDAKNQVDMINDAAKKATVITTDTDSPKSDRLCFVGTNNLEAGKKAGELLKKALPHGGKVWVFVATLDMQNAADRYQGILDTVKGTGIRIMEVKTDNAQRDRAKSNVEEVLVQHPDVAALVGLFSYNGPEIASAVEGKKSKVKIVCFDEDKATLSAVRSGLIEGTVVQDPYKFGYECVRVLAALARKQDAKIPASKVIDTGVRVIDKTNVDEFEKEFDKKLSGK